MCEVGRIACTLLQELHLTHRWTELHLCCTAPDTCAQAYSELRELPLSVNTVFPLPSHSPPSPPPPHPRFTIEDGCYTSASLLLSDEAVKYYPGTI